MSGCVCVYARNGEDNFGWVGMDVRERNGSTGLSFLLDDRIISLFISVNLFGTEDKT